MKKEKHGKIQNRTYKTRKSATAIRIVRTIKRKTGGSNRKKINCAPVVEGKSIHENTCFTPEIMIQLKAAYNNKFPDDRIQSEQPNEIWKILHDKINQKTCNKKTEICWIDTLIPHKKMREKMKDLFFRPEQPKEWTDNPDEWLSNYDIFEVAKQYEEVYPSFKMISPTSIDFDDKRKNEPEMCVSTELCNFSLANWMKKGKDKFGIVFNLDKHYEPGSHWVTLWVDVPEKVIVFFDSAGNGLPEEVDTLIQRIVKQGNSFKMEFQIYNNGRHAHQSGNTECGMYSLFFIITMLTGKIPPPSDGAVERVLTMKERIDLFMKGNIHDKTVFDYRDLYFNPHG